MPRHLGPDDLVAVRGVLEYSNPEQILGSEDFDSGTIGTEIDSPNTFLTDAFHSGSITFEAGGYTGQKAYCVAAGSHFLEHSLGGSFPDWRSVGTVDVKIKVDSLPTNQWTVLGGMQNAPSEDYVFGINTVGNIGIGYVNPNTATKTTYAVAPEEWFRVVFTYRNDYTITLGLFHGDNIEGTVPDETIQRQGSYQNLRYLIFGKNEGWSNSVAVSYDDLVLSLEPLAYEAPVPQRSNLQFTGAGIESVEDNPGNDSTDVTVGGGAGGGLTYGGFAYWYNSMSISAAGTDSPDLGALSDSIGDLSWFDSGGSNLSGGVIKVAERGLYRANFAVYYNNTSAPPDVDLFSIYGRVSPTGVSYRYEMHDSVEIDRLSGTARHYIGVVEILDVLEIGGTFTFRFVKDASTFATRTVNINTSIVRVG